MNDKSQTLETTGAVDTVVLDEKAERFREERARQILAAAQQFIVDADALEEVLELSTPVLVAKQQEHRQELEQLLNQVQSSGTELQLDVGELHRLTSLAAKLSRGGFLFRGHLLVALVSRFDAFVAAVALELLTAFPERLGKRSLAYIHSEGKASPQYFRVCAEHKVKFKKSPKEGTKLNVTTEYLGYARKVLSEMAFKLSQTIVRKVFSESQKVAELHVTMIGIQLLKEERWEEALVFFEYGSGLRDKWAGDEVTKRNNIINKAQALIGLGKRDAAMKAIESVDWSASHPKYLLAIHLLKDEFKEAAALMPSADLKESYYRDWSIFSRFRVTDEFKTAFASLFGHEFGATMDDVSQAIAVIEENKAPNVPIEHEPTDVLEQR